SLLGNVDAMMLIPDPVCAAPEPFNQILAFTTEQKIPLVAFADSFVRRGALVGLGIDFREQGVLGAELVAHLLEGADPASLPIQSPRKYLIYYNLRQAKALNITIPEMLLNLADKVFEQ
ncbi:MAG: ABC transporter substrate binding protein, partial [Fimbriimonadales bacterium]